MLAVGLLSTLATGKLFKVTTITVTAEEVLTEPWGGPAAALPTTTLCCRTRCDKKQKWDSYIGKKISAGTDFEIFLDTKHGHVGFCYDGICPGYAFTDVEFIKLKKVYLTFHSKYSNSQVTIIDGALTSPKEHTLTGLD